MHVEKVHTLDIGKFVVVQIMKLSAFFRFGILLGWIFSFETIQEFGESSFRERNPRAGGNFVGFQIQLASLELA